MISLSIVVLTVCILSACFSLAEASIVGLTEYKVKNLQKQGLIGTNNLLKVMECRSHYLSTVILLNTIVNVAGSMLIGTLAVKIFQDLDYYIFTGALTFILLVFSEVKPKVYASARSEKVGRFIAGPVIFFGFVLNPIVKFISAFVGDRGATDRLSIHEVKTFLASAGDEGIINEEESKIAKNVFNLRDRKAKELILSDGKITVIDVSSSLSDALKVALSTQHKRIIAVNKKGQPIGVILQRDILKSNFDEEQISSVAELVYPVHTVDQDCSLSSLAIKLYHSDTHLAVILDDSGEMIGVISLSNIQELLLS